MELDFRTVRALSSPTRLEILSELMEGESTTTNLSNALGKSKSTVSSHLEKLLEAGLVEKDQVDGRRRVIYRPTDRSRDIVKGKEKRVKFSLAGSAVSGVAGIGLLSLVGRSSMVSEDEADSAEGPEAFDAAPSAEDSVGTETSVELLQSNPELLAAAGGLLILVALTVLLYGLVLKKLSQ